MCWNRTQIAQMPQMNADFISEHLRHLRSISPFLCDAAWQATIHLATNGKSVLYSMTTGVTTIVN